MLKRPEIQVLRRAGHPWMEVAALSGVSVRTARRVAEEAAVTTVDNAAERARRRAARPSTAEAYRDVIARARADGRRDVAVGGVAAPRAPLGRQVALHERGAFAGRRLPIMICSLFAVLTRRTSTRRRG